MKAFITTCLLVISSTVFAMPKVGDMATYVAKANGYEFTVKTEILAFDAASNTFKRQETTTFMGQQQVEVEDVAVEEIPSDLQLQMVLAYCTSPDFNGKLETIKVPAGTFNTCLVSQNGTLIYFGLVPMGIVKLVSPDSSLELSNFKIAQ
jgi:hypothetical protein